MQKFWAIDKVRASHKDYTPFFNAIKGNCTEWWHFLDSTFIVATPQSAHDFAQALYPHIENTDHFIVSRLQPESQGWMPQAAWDWLNSKEF
jgi:hypothetical protein